LTLEVPFRLSSFNHSFQGLVMKMIRAMFHLLAAVLLLSTLLAPTNANLEGTKRI
jgi:hypothetical protein